jgi:hypothetical protein
MANSGKIEVDFSSTTVRKKQCYALKRARESAVTKVLKRQ